MRNVFIAIGMSVAAIIATTVNTLRSSHDAGFLPRRERARRTAAVLVSFLNYSDTYGGIPPATRYDVRGRMLYSWRFDLLGFYEPIHSRREWGSPWYAAENHELTSTAAPYYCFSEATERRERQTTTLVALTGPGTAFDESAARCWKDLPPQLIILIEVAKLGFHWAEPGDLDISDVDASIISGLDGRGVLVGFADGQVWFVDRNVTVEQLHTFMTISEAETSDRRDLQRSYTVRVH